MALIYAVLAPFRKADAAPIEMPSPFWPYFSAALPAVDVRILAAYQRELDAAMKPKPGGGYELTAMCPSCRSVVRGRTGDTDNAMTWECEACEVVMDPLEQIIETARRVGGGDN